MPFEKFLVLCHSLIRSLYFIQVYIFTLLIHSSPHSYAFHTFCRIYINLFMCITPCEFFLSLVMLLGEGSESSIFVFYSS